MLGFSSMSLFYTLSSGFIKLMLLSVIFAWPLAYGAYKFLPGANKYQIQVWEFLLGTGIILVLALATISFQIVKATKTKPVDVLKDE